MRLFVMGESLFRAHEASRARVTPARVLVFGFMFCVLFGAAFIFLYWWVENVSLKQAWQAMGPMMLAASAFIYAVLVGSVFFQEWSYRRTKALPASIRGFDIEARPMDHNRGETLRERLRFAMDGPQQRDWERTRSRGVIPFVMWWVVALSACMVFLFLGFWLIGGPLQNIWEEMGWELASFPIMGIVLGIGFWFLNEWSYRKGKTRTVVHP